MKSWASRVGPCCVSLTVKQVVAASLVLLLSTLILVSRSTFASSTTTTFRPQHAQHQPSTTGALLAKKPSFPNASSSSQSHLQQVANSFESVLKSSNRSDDIPMDSLLHACHTFLSILHKTGPKAVAHDFANNLKKIESLYHSSSVSGSHPHSARTLSSLLALEKDSGIHRSSSSSKDGNSRLILKDPSGAVGLLWIRRSLAFQTDLYHQLLEGGHHDTTDAAMHAYRRQLEPHHGWALRRFYTAFLKTQMPSRDYLLSKLGGYDDQHARIGNDDDEIIMMHQQRTVQDLERLVRLWRPLLRRWKRTFEELGMEDTRRV